jgi:hypothetical protein
MDTRQKFETLSSLLRKLPLSTSIEYLDLECDDAPFTAEVARFLVHDKFYGVDVANEDLMKVSNIGMLRPLKYDLEKRPLQSAFGPCEHTRLYTFKTLRKAP